MSLILSHALQLDWSMLQTATVCIFAGQHHRLRLTAAAYSEAWSDHCQTSMQGIDVDRSGTITVDELKAGMKKAGSPIALAELQGLLAHIDVDGSGTHQHLLSSKAFSTANSCFLLI